MPPSISIVVPCYNEEQTIGSLLGAILDQTYPRQQLEVVIADGLSQDLTRDVISRFREAHPDLSLRVVDNLQRTIPSGLNLAIGEARGEIIVRLDAHSMPIPEYVEKCVEAIEQGKGNSVGGVWTIRPGAEGWIAAGIAAAAAHPMGAGDALYRVGAKQGEVDTVPFGTFRRSLVEKIGGFEESLLTNEDYEFNARIRKSGGTVWLDPSIGSTYFARATIVELARQYWRYGLWKRRMLARHPDTLRLRQAIPPLFVLSLCVLAVLGAFWRPAWMGLGAELVLYFVALLASALDISVRRREPRMAPVSILAFVTMHVAWGAGFLWSLAWGAAKNHG